MNTPGHAVVNLALLGASAAGALYGAHRGPVRALPILAGAILPDVPILVFYVWQRVILRLPEHVIWGGLYFVTSWQVVFDLFHSLPLAVVGFLVARGRRHTGAAGFFASVAFHALCDLPLHHEDAHRHLYPLSDWRFASPISYWDPRHNGALAALGETCVVTAAAALLWPRFPSAAPRLTLVLVLALYVTAYVAFYLVA